jgi:uncharacterized lipoprotein YmbA
MHYYTLSEVATDARLNASAEGIPVRVDRVTIPSELDRSQLVRRVDATRLQIAEQDRWAAPLDEMIRRVLSADLAARLPANLVADPNEPPLGERRRLLSVDVQEFFGDSGCTVTLRAAWVMKQPDAPSVRATEEVRTPSSGACSGAGDLPEAMSRALAQLSDRLAPAIARSADASGR